jgi:hypothetical protein
MINHSRHLLSEINKKTIVQLKCKVRRGLPFPSRNIGSIGKTCISMIWLLVTSTGFVAVVIGKMEFRNMCWWVSDMYLVHICPVFFLRKNICPIAGSHPRKVNRHMSLWCPFHSHCGEDQHGTVTKHHDMMTIEFENILYY